MNKIVTVTDREVIESLQGKVRLLYPLKSYSVGYLDYFDIQEIDDFVLINRLLTDTDIDNLTKILHDGKFQGIVFDDLGILEIIQDLKIEKILLLDHLACNHESINYYLDYVDSVVVSNDLTKEEIMKIVPLCKKKMIINVFGLKTLMYSRRKLVSNYQTHYGLLKENIIQPNILDKHFIVVEDELGTKFYAYPYYNALELLNLENILYYWYDPILLKKTEILNLVDHEDINGITTDKIFLEQKCVYKVGDLDA